MSELIKYTLKVKVIIEATETTDKSITDYTLQILAVSSADLISKWLVNLREIYPVGRINIMSGPTKVKTFSNEPILDWTL